MRNKTSIDGMCLPKKNRKAIKRGIKRLLDVLPVDLQNVTGEYPDLVISDYGISNEVHELTLTSDTDITDIIVGEDNQRTGLENLKYHDALGRVVTVTRVHSVDYRKNWRIYLP